MLTAKFDIFEGLSEKRYLPYDYISSNSNGVRNRFILMHVLRKCVQFLNLNSVNPENVGRGRKHIAEGKSWIR